MLEHRVTIRLVARQSVEGGKGDRTFAVGPAHPHDGVERRQGHRHIRGMGRDAGGGGAQDGEIAVVALARWAPSPRRPFIAGQGNILEVDATSPLQEVPSGRGEVAQLPGGAGEQRLREQGETRPDDPIGGEVAVPCRRADSRASIGQRLDPVVGQVGHVD